MERDPIIAPEEVSQTLEKVKDNQERLLDLLSKSEIARERERSSARTLSWLTLGVTFISSVIIGSLLGWQDHQLRKRGLTVQEESEIRANLANLMSPEDGPRLGAEKFLGEHGGYVDLVTDSAEKFGDMRALSELSQDPSVAGRDAKTRYGQASQKLDDEWQVDKKCLNSNWRETHDTKGDYLTWTFDVQSPRVLRMSRGGLDQGGWFTIRKQDPANWSGISGLAGYDHKPVTITVDYGNCATIQTSYGSFKKVSSQ